MRFFAAAIWGFLVLAGLIGWGTCLTKLLRRGKILSWGLSGAIGFSFSVVVGGVLGQFHVIKPMVVIFFIVLGLLLLVLRLSARTVEYPIPGRRRMNLPPAVMGFLFVALIFLASSRYLSAIHQTVFQPLDDTPAYIVFPVKMLQTGQFAPDPFSDRRMNGLGGQQWSESLVMAPFDVTVINLFDHGVAFLLLLLICWEWLQSIGCETAFSVMLLLTITLTYPDYVNSCSFVTISSVLLALFVLLLDGVENIREAILLGILVAALCSLKTTVIPFVGVILAIHFLIRTIQTRSAHSFIFATGLAAMAFAFLSPWMLSMHQSSNTFLAPLLGHGNSMLDKIAGHMPHRTVILLMSLAGISGAGAVTIVWCMRNMPEHQNWAWTGFAFLLGTAPVIYLVANATGGLGWLRYAEPFIYGWIAIPIAALWIWSNSGGFFQKSIGRAAAAGIALVAILSSATWAKPYGPVKVIGEQFSLIAEGFHWKPMKTDSDQKQAIAMQASVPAGAALLARVNDPSLLDFSRNPIYIADHPGLAYPPPGLPPEPGPEELRDFLLKHNVRYVAYSYGDEANFRHDDPSVQGKVYAWDLLVTQRTFGVQDVLSALRRSQKILYDDQMTAVIDLMQSASQPVF